MSQTCYQCGKTAGPNAKFCPACGAQLGVPPVVQRLQPGQLIHNGNYRILRTLGKGGMGLVYVAENLQAFSRLCVVKEMLDYFDPTDPQQAAAAHQRFEDEARVLSRLNHPGIPGIQAYFSEAGHNYIVMDFVDGHNLEQMLGQQLSESQVLGYGMQICEILEYLAGLRPPVVHHDIKPANVIVDASANRARLVDFGTAKARLSAQPGGNVGVQKSSIYGTVGYAPPEQYKGQSEPRSDVYALAATLYHVLTNDDPGMHAFTFPKLGGLAPGVRAALTPCFEEVSLRCTASDFRRALQAAIAAPARQVPRNTAAIFGSLPAHESYAVISSRLPSQLQRPQVTRVLQAELGLADTAAEVLTWQAPMAYLREASGKAAQALQVQLESAGFRVNVVRTSQVLSWRASLGAAGLQRLRDVGEAAVDKLSFPQDRVCQCHGCGHHWTTQAQDISRLRATCSKCGRPWYVHRIFRCHICGHEFAHSDMAQPAAKLYPQCPACHALAWLPTQQPHVAKTNIKIVERMPAGSIKTLQITIPGANGVTLQGRALFNTPWIQTAEALNAGKVDVTLNAASLQQRQTYRANGVVITNGGTTQLLLETYIEAPPLLAVDTPHLDFGLVKAQVTQSLGLSIHNEGDQHLNGTITSSHKWLQIAKVTFQNQETIQCRVTGADLDRPGINTATLTIDSNGGKATVPVTVTVLPTTLEVKPAAIDFGHRPHSGVAHADVLIENSGVGQLAGALSTSAPWLTLDRTAFAANECHFKLTVKLASLPRGAACVEQITVISSGGTTVIPVQVRVSRYGAFGHALRYSRVVQLLLLLVLAGCSYWGWQQVAQGQGAAVTWGRGTASPIATGAFIQPPTTVQASAVPLVATPFNVAGESPLTAPITLAVALTPEQNQAASFSTTSTATPIPTATVGLAAVPRSVLTSTPTSTSTSTPLPTATKTATPMATSTPTFTASPTATPAPTASPFPAPTEAQVPPVNSWCPDPQVQITFPYPGAQVRGRVAVVGSALDESFSYYKLENARDGSDRFSYLAGGASPVDDGLLAEFDSAALANGPYVVRLTVVDASGNYPAPCSVPITIRN